MLHFAPLASSIPARNPATLPTLNPSQSAHQLHWHVSHVRNQPDTRLAPPGTGRTLQYWINHVIGGSVHVLRFAIQTGAYTAHVNANNAMGESALVVAVIQQNLLAVELLLHLPGIDVNARDRYGSTVLELARRGISQASQLIVARLLQHPQIVIEPELPDMAPYAASLLPGDHTAAGVNGESNTGESNTVGGMYQTPASSSLIDAVRLGRYDLASALLKSPDTAVNAVDGYGGTALSWAAYVGGRAGEAIVRLLLRHPQIDVTLDDPMTWAARQGHGTIVQLIANFRAAQAGRRLSLATTETGHAVENRMPPEVASMTPSDASMTAWPSTAAQCIAADGGTEKEGVKAQVQLQTIVKKSKHRGYSFNVDLMHFNKFLSRFHRLLPARQAWMLARCRNLRTELKKNLWLVYAIGGTPREVNFLLACDLGLDIINAFDADGKTALLAAARYGRLRVFSALLEIPGIDVNHCDKYGRTALSYAASGGFKKIVLLLLAHRDINPNGGAPLIAAASRNRVSIVERLLLVPGIDVNAMINGHTAIGNAARNNNRKIIKRLVERSDIDVNLGAALCLAASHGADGAVRQLLADHRLDLGVRDVAGRTALQLARLRGEAIIVQRLTNAIEDVDLGAAKLSMK